MNWRCWTMLLLVTTTAQAATIYVDGRRRGGDGTSWSTALPGVQDALARARGGDEIWVAEGTYRLSRRNETFQLKAGVGLYGGFAGNEARREQRDWQQHPTVLDGNGAYHVVTGADQAVLDGFAVIGGKADGPPSSGRGGRQPGSGGGIHTSPQAILGGAGGNFGGGLLCYQTAPTVRNCTFENNWAGKGGAVYCMTSSNFRPGAGSAKVPVFINCVFRHNQAQGRGGGVSNDLGTAPVFLNCVFDGNRTPAKGGGMYNDFACSPTLINCLFTANEAQDAAGMGNDGGSSPVLYYCTFAHNHATDTGPSLYQGTGPANNPAVVYCAFTGNTCDWGSPGVYNWHLDTPRIVAHGRGDGGYRPGRFSEAQLPQLLQELVQYKAQRQPAVAADDTVRVPTSRRIVYVDAAHTGPGDGRTWDSAYATLQAGLDDAGRDGGEVHVAAGTYRLSGDRSQSFMLHPGVRVYGGYANKRRDPAHNQTVLDGNHAYHVLVGAYGALLDGLTITGGQADGSGYGGQGGGLINYRRAPQDRPNAGLATGFDMAISYCTFTGNSAREGGAVYSYDHARPVFTECTFRDNRADNGGAVLDRVGVESVFRDCVFDDNTAQWRGGALYFDYGARPRLSGCILRRNTTNGHGGALYSLSRASQLENTTVELTNCRFEANTAKGYGGAANFHDSTLATVRGCAFSGNGAGLKGNAIAVTGDSSLELRGNTVSAADVYQEPATRRGGRPGSVVSIKATDGTSACTCTVPQTCATMVLSSPSIKTGTSYAVYTGGTVTATNAFKGLCLGALGQAGGSAGASFTASAGITKIGGVYF